MSAVQLESPPAEQREEGTPPPPRKRRTWLIILTVAVALFFTIPLVSMAILRIFVVQTFYIPSGSMAPTLAIGNRIIVDRLSFDNHPITTGDIVVFTTPPSENCGGPKSGDLVKRVVGLPGQTISIKDQRVYINGKRLDESWLPAVEQGYTLPGPEGPAYSLVKPYVIPPNDYYVMGDNRSWSCDSRFWGPVTRNEIVGKVILRIWPFSSLQVF
jgi:signal peptidase I